MPLVQILGMHPLVIVAAVLGSAAFGWLVFDKLRGVTSKAVDGVENPTLQTVLRVVHEAGYSLVGAQIENLEAQVKAAQAPDSDGGAAITEAEASAIGASVLPALWDSLGDTIKAGMMGAYAGEVGAKKVAGAMLVTQARQQIQASKMAEVVAGEATVPLAPSGLLSPAILQES